MRLQINTKTLKDALDITSKALAVKSNIPILENFFIYATDNKTIAIVASDGEISIKKEIPAVEAEGCAVFSPILSEMMKTIESENVTISDNGTIAVIDYWIGTASIPVYSPNDYPNFKSDSGEEIEIDAPILASALERTLPFVSNDDLRPVMTGINFSVQENKIDVVASDAHVLSVCEIKQENAQQFNFIVPSKAMSILKDSIIDAKMKVTVTPKNATFTIGNTTITCRIIEGRYPAYRSIIPQGFSTNFKTEKDKLQKTLKRISITSDKASPTLCCKLTSGDAIIESKSLIAQTSAKEAIERSAFTGDDITIGFNAKNFAKAISATEGKTVEFRLNRPNMAAVILGENENNIILVMPVQLNY